MKSDANAEFQQVEVDWVVIGPREIPTQQKVGRWSEVAGRRKAENTCKQFTRPNGGPYKLHAINGLHSKKI